MRSQVVRACVVVLFGFAASPVMAQTADTAMTPPGEPVLAPVGSVVDTEAPVIQYDLDGPRIGLTFVPDGAPRTQFEWHLENQAAPGTRGPWFLVERILLIGGVENSELIPSTIGFGVRAPSSFEFGVGPSITLAGDSVPAPGSVPAPAPDPARIATLLFMLQNFDDVRVVTNSARLVRRDPVVSPDGLRLRSASRGISVQARPEERLVPWAEIESIQVRRGASGIGPLAGAAIGFAIGLSIYMAQMPTAIFSLGQQQPSGTPILVGLAGGAALGWLIDRPGPWRTVYP